MGILRWLKGASGARAVAGPPDASAPRSGDAPAPAPIRDDADAPAVVGNEAEAQALQLIEAGHRCEADGRFDEAFACYERAVAQAPQLPRAHLNRGNALLQRGDAVAALQAYGTALAHDPGYAGAHFNSGNAQAGLGRREEAVQSYRKALAIDPDFVDAHVALGAVLRDLGRRDEAIASYQRALALAPNYAEVHCNLGLALRDSGRFEDAERSYRRALAIDPSLVLALNNLGSVLKDLGRLDEAAASYDRALALNPDDLDAFSNRLFCQNYDARVPRTQLMADARRFGERAARAATPFSTWAVSADPDRCLRVGIVSGDLCNHPVGFFLESAIAALASRGAGRIELVAYPTWQRDDELTARLRPSFRAWTPIEGRTDAQAARAIHADRIDILLDLSGHTAHNRLALFAWKPAPVQVSWLGYFATTGVAAIEYFVADPFTFTDAQADAFTESVWTLPETRLCFTAPAAAPAVGPLPAAHGAPFTFGCFNNLSKLNEPVLALWARVLTAVPGSRLFLKAPQLGEASVRARVADTLGRLGVAADRLIFEGLSARADYLAAYGRVDIALDPFPFTGGTTTAEALWMGVPVLTLAGDSLVSRQGVGILTNAGLPDWVAADGDDLVRRAAAQAAALPALAGLRAGLREQVRASPLMDAPRFAAGFEAALRAMWRGWCGRHGDNPGRT